jgi:hypothetical protein
MTGDLAQDMRRGTEAIESQSAHRSAQSIGPVADQTGAEQRGQGDRVCGLIQRKDEPGIGDAILSIAAIEAIAGEPGRIAEVFPTCVAVGALAAGMPEPGHANPLPDRQARHTQPQSFHPAHDLVPRDQGQLRPLEIVVHDMEIGPADPAAFHAQQNLQGAGRAYGHVTQFELRRHAVKHHRPHGHLPIMVP